MFSLSLEHSFVFKKNPGNLFGQNEVWLTAINML